MITINLSESEAYAVLDVLQDALLQKTNDGSFETKREIMDFEAIVSDIERQILDAESDGDVPF